MEEITLVKCASGFVLKQTSGPPGMLWASGSEPKPTIWAFSTIEEVGDYLTVRFGSPDTVVVG